MVVPRPGTHRGPMETRGYTLVELLVVLLLLAGLLAIAMPGMKRWRDRAAVHAAREELAGALAWTRITAASHTDGATLVLDPGSARFHTRTATGPTPEIDLRRRYGVELDIGSDRLALFRYDALGIGRIASRTIRIHRGSAEAGLTVSAYGRFRRW